MALETYRLADGRTLRYDLRHQGAGDRPVIVFVNGLSQTTVAWGLQLQRLHGARNTLVYDASGQGRSSPPPDGWRPEQHAGDLVELLDGLGLDVVDLVGFSFGSRTALRLALARPERVRRMILAGCAHRETAVRRWIVRGWKEALEKGGMESCFRVVTGAVVGEEWLATNEHLYDSMLRAFVRRNDPDAMLRLLADSLLPHGDITDDQLRTLGHPTRVLRGAQDLVVPRVLNDELVAALPDATFSEHPRCGHSIAIERPDWFATELRSHLL